MASLIIVAYFGVLLLLCTYGAHRAHLVWLCYRHRKRLAAVGELPALVEADLPRVTIQLPLYNEATVVERLLDAVATMDYPRDRLEIQVLDDSNDETIQLARRKVERLRDQGLDIHYVRRPDRVGYKAGALEYGLTSSTGEFIAIFHADFIPQPDFVRATIGHFADPKIAMVQRRWQHLNQAVSLLTEIQAMMLNGHHLVENRARCAAGHLFNFSGTGGIWRRAAIDDAGGWEHDTITEDLDLSYRAQLRGWRFIYRPDVTTPAELPEEMSAFRAQQYRWAKGTVQTARKHLRRILNDGGLGVEQRIEAVFHLTPHFAYPLMLLLSVLLLPALILIPATDVLTMALVDLPLCLGATGSLAAFYCSAERAGGGTVGSALRRLPALIALGAGLSPHLSRAVLDGWNDMAGEFIRTPKRGRTAGRYRQRAQLPMVELGLLLLSLCAVVASIETGHYFATPFTMLFAGGYGYVSYLVVSEQLSVGDAAPSTEVAPAAE